MRYLNIILWACLIALTIHLAQANESETNEIDAFTDESENGELIADTNVEGDDDNDGANNEISSGNGTQRWIAGFLGQSVINTNVNGNKVKPTNYQTLFDQFNGMPDDIGSFGSFDRHPCRRVCQQGQSLNCYYRLVVHNYRRLGPECRRCISDPSACDSEYCIFGDGVATPIKAINRQQPAPPIEVCENDTIVVDLLNYLAEPTTMHWHGVHMSRTPDMDGAPFITQYPVQPSEVYRYSFTADRSGTNWYHSHMSWQRAMGVAGAFIVRQTRQENRHAHLYDYDLIEHTLIIHDIFYDYDVNRVSNILINGKGRNHLNSLPDSDPRHRYERIRVTPGYRYRMRVISNGVFSCPIEFSIENHKMLMISTDGNDIQPILADSFFMASAERFDFVLEANQYASNYWIRVRGYDNCSDANLYQGAVLNYRGASRKAQPQAVIGNIKLGNATADEKQSVVVNYQQTGNTPKDQLHAKPKDTTNIATAGLRSLTPLPWPRYTKFLTYYSSFGMRTDRSGRKLYQVDDITFRLPSISMLQGNHLFNENYYFCNQSSLLAAGRNCLNENCECVNVIRLPAYKPIELIVANYMDSAHPFHVHGYTFRLVGQGVIGNVADLRRIHELDRRGILQRTPDDYPAVEKDSIQIPGLGYIIVRFISDNPGYWLYHCHIESHVIQGMAAVLKIGGNEHIKKIPPKIRC